MLKYIDRFINNRTMYRLVHEILIVYVGLAIVLSFFGYYDLRTLLVSLFTLTIFCQLSNVFLAKVFKAPMNKESWVITALILFLIMPNAQDFEGVKILAFAGFIAILSKFVLVYKRKHIFNPATVGALLSGILLNAQAFWWVGSTYFLPFTLIFGLLLVRKLRRSYLFLSFLFFSTLSILFTTLTANSFDISLITTTTLKDIFLSWPLIFFGTIMLTEPQTTPPKRNQQIIYGSVIGLLFGSTLHIGNLYMSPELALIIGNIYSFIVSFKARVMMKLKEKNMIAQDIYKFFFTPDKTFNFIPGQYLEWTLPMSKSDSRGNRRVFSIASAPNTSTVDIAMKIKEDGSTFKKELLKMESGSIISVTGLAGDFVLPKEQGKKLVFIAGGIGITPFMSMIDNLYNTKEKRDIVFFYSCATGNDFAFREDIEVKKMDIGIKSVFLVGKQEDAAQADYVGFLTVDIIKKEVPDYSSRTYYLSGPSVMVDNYKKLLLSLNIKRSQIITDYFPGY